MGLLSFLRALRASSPRAVGARLEALTAGVHALPEAEARDAVRRHLAAGDVFRAERSRARPLEERRLEGAPAAVRELFGEYRLIALGGMRLDRDEVAPWERAAGHLRIGADLEHADVVVRLADAHVVVSEDDGESVPNVEDAHPSIWHYMLDVVAATRGAPGGQGAPAD